MIVCVRRARFSRTYRSDMGQGYVNFRLGLAASAFNAVRILSCM